MTGSAETEIFELGISELADKIRDGSMSPVDVMQATLARIEDLNGDLNAFLSVYPEQAMAAARQAEIDIKAGRIQGPPAWYSSRHQRFVRG